MLICKIHSNSNKCSLKQTLAKYSREFLIDNIFMCGERVFSTDSGHPYEYRCSSCRLTIYLCVVNVFFQQTVDIHMGTDAPLVAWQYIYVWWTCFFNRQSTSIWVPMLLLSPDNIFMCGGRVFSTDSRYSYGYQCSSYRLTIYFAK
jgi:hypothetical protein